MTEPYEKGRTIHRMRKGVLTAGTVLFLAGTFIIYYGVKYGLINKTIATILTDDYEAWMATSAQTGWILVGFGATIAVAGIVVILFGMFKEVKLSLPTRASRRGRTIEGMTFSEIPQLIHYLQSPSETARENALWTLRHYTGFDLGYNAQAWQEWYEKYKDKPPEEWYKNVLSSRGCPVSNLEGTRQVSALLYDMESSDPQVRRFAYKLLVSLTGIEEGFTSAGIGFVRRRQLKRIRARLEKMGVLTE